MSIYYEINEDDYKNLIKDLSVIGVSQIIGKFSAQGTFSLEENYLEFEGDFNSQNYETCKNYLNGCRFYWQLYGNPLRQKISIPEIMEDLASRTDLELNERHNLYEKKYRRRIEININVNKEYPNITIELITPTLIIYDLKGLSFSNLIKKGRKEVRNGRIEL